MLEAWELSLVALVRSPHLSYTYVLYFLDFSLKVWLLKLWEPSILNHIDSHGVNNFGFHYEFVVLFQPGCCIFFYSVKFSSTFSTNDNWHPRMLEDDISERIVYFQVCNFTWNSSDPQLLLRKHPAETSRLILGIRWKFPPLLTSPCVWETMIKRKALHFLYGRKRWILMKNIT